MRHAVIHYTETTPKWDTLPTIFIDNERKNSEANVTACAQICYDDNVLYLHMWAKEANIRAEVTDPMGQPCQDSCLEFFFRPDPNDMRYFNIEFNPIACSFLGFGSCFEDLVRLHPMEEQFHPTVNRTDEGWEIFYSIPFSFIRLFFPKFAPETGRIIRANFYKCGDLTPIPHYYSWCIPASRPHGFHCPECFGTLIFDKKGEEYEF